MKKEHKKEMYGLCFRCEYRAAYLQDKLNAGENEFVGSPRLECSATRGVRSCYMYRPVRPYILKPNEGEKRSITWPAMISGRAHAVGVANTKIVGHKLKEGVVFLCQLTKKAVSKLNKENVKNKLADNYSEKKSVLVKTKRLGRKVAK